MKPILLIATAICVCGAVRSQSIDMISYFGSTGTVQCKSMVSAPNGDMLVAGIFQDQVDFEPGDGITELNGASANTQYDSYLGRYNADGELLWVKSWQLGNPPFDARHIVRLFSNGDILLVGHHEAGTADMDPGAGYVGYPISNGSCYALRLTPDGEFISVAGNDGNNVTPFEAQVDASDNIYVAGVFQGTTDFDGSANTASMTATGTTNTFLLKMDSAGNYQWARNWGAPSSYTMPAALAVDTDGNALVAGVFTASVLDLNPGAGTNNVNNYGSTGTQDGWICKLDPIGVHVWSGSIGSGDDDFMTAVDTDDDGNVYLGGMFDGPCDVDPTVVVQEFTPLSLNEDSFVVKMDAGGATQFIHHFGSSFGVDLDELHVDQVNGKYWIAGRFYLQTDFDPGTDVFIPTGSTGGYLCSYDLDGTFDMHRFIGHHSGDEVHIHANASGDLYLAQTTLSPFTIYTTNGPYIFSPDAGGSIMLMRISNCVEPIVTSVTLDPAFVVACTEDIIDVTATATNGGDNPLFAWYVNEYLNTGDTDMNNEFSFAAYINGPVISCGVISSLGCAVGYPSPTVPVEMEVGETFTPNVVALATGSCPNTPLTIEAFIENGGASPAIQWYQDGEAIPGATDTTYTTIGEDQLTEFYFQLIVAETCATEDTLISNTYTIYYATMPNVNVSVFDNTLYGFLDASNDYQWLDCENNFAPIPGADESNYTATESGTYALMAYNAFCADTSICHEVTFTPDYISESEDFGFHVEPNPSQGLVNITYDNALSGMKITVLNSLGKMVHSEYLEYAPKNTLNLSTLEKGVYFIRLENDNGVVVEKVVME